MRRCKICDGAIPDTWNLTTCPFCLQKGKIEPVYEKMMEHFSALTLQDKLDIIFLSLLAPTEIFPSHAVRWVYERNLKILCDNQKEGQNG